MNFFFGLCHSISGDHAESYRHAGFATGFHNGARRLARDKLEVRRLTAHHRTATRDRVVRAALRKLWLSDPAFAFRDGLDDYDENFRIVDKMLATADELRKGWKGTEEQAETVEPGEEKDEDDAGDAEIAAAEGDEEAAAAEGDEEAAAAEGDEEASDGTPEPGRPEKEQG